MCQHSYRLLFIWMFFFSYIMDWLLWTRSVVFLTVKVPFRNTTNILSTATEDRKPIDEAKKKAIPHERFLVSVWDLG